MDNIRNDHSYHLMPVSRAERCSFSVPSNPGWVQPFNPSAAYLQGPSLPSLLTGPSIVRPTYLYTSASSSPPITTLVPRISTFELNTSVRYVAFSPINGIFVGNMSVSAITILYGQHFHYCPDWNTFIPCAGLIHSLCPFHIHLGPMDLLLNNHPIYLHIPTPLHREGSQNSQRSPPQSAYESRRLRIIEVGSDGNVPRLVRNDSPDIDVVEGVARIAVESSLD